MYIYQSLTFTNNLLAGSLGCLKIGYYTSMELESVFGSPVSLQCFAGIFQPSWLDLWVSRTGLKYCST